MGRSPRNPVNGSYGLRKGYLGRFAMCLSPLPEELGLAGLTYEARTNKMRTRYVTGHPHSAPRGTSFLDNKY
ncbi:MAG: DUF6855 family protein [Acidimicrobiales bacterium]